MNCCLVGWGASAIYQVSHVGPGYDRLGLAHELSIFFFIGLLAFALFFLEYNLVERLTKRKLNEELGYLQSLACVFMFVLGVLAIYYTHWGPTGPQDAAFPDYMLGGILAFGHLVFIGNVVWTYLQEGRAS